MSQEPCALAAVRYECFVCAKFHSQSFGNEFGQLLFQPDTVALASFHTEDKVIRITNIFDTFARLSGTGHF